jgi:hypothetical protein
MMVELSCTFVGELDGERADEGSRGKSQYGGQNSPRKTNVKADGNAQD